MTTVLYLSENFLSTKWTQKIFYGAKRGVSFKRQPPAAMPRAVKNHLVWFSFKVSYDSVGSPILRGAGSLVR